MKPILSLLTLSLLLGLSCTKSGDPSYVSLNEPKLSLAHQGGVGYDTLAASQRWTATVTDNWLQVTPLQGGSGSNPLTFTADANSSVTNRTAIVTFLCGTASTTLAVTQPSNQGNAVFYLVGGDVSVNVNVYLNEQYQGILSQRFAEPATCQQQGALTLNLAAGTYSWSARATSGRSWPATPITITATGCQVQPINFE